MTTTSETQALALALLDDAAEALAATRARHTKELAPVMDRVKDAILAADRAGVPRMTIVERSGVSLRTAYKILPKKEQS